MDSAHSVLKPSSAGRWVHCPGSVSMEEAYPSPDNGYNLDGQAAHNIAAMKLRGSTLYLHAGAIDHTGAAITEEMADAAALYAADIRETVGHLPAHIEERVTVAPVHPLCFGTPDYWAWDPNTLTLYVWDLKYGFGIVEAVLNWQLMCYAAGIMHAIQLPEYQVNLVLRIVQPRAQHPEGPVREWRVPATEIRAHVNKLFNSAALAVTPDPQIEALHSGQHCRYCSGRHACPALRESAYYACDISKRLEIEDMSSAALGLEYRLLQAAAERIEYRLTGVEAQVMARTRAGDLSTGFRIESALGRLSWDRAASEIFKLGDLLAQDLRKAPDPITPAQAIKAGLDKTVAEQYSSRKPTAFKLVPSDKTLASKAFGKGN